MTKAEYSFISSTAVKEVAFFGGSLASLVPPMVGKKVASPKRWKWTTSLSLKKCTRE